MASPREREGDGRDESFPKSRRIRRRGEYRDVQSRGRRVVTAHYVCLVRANDGLGPRLGVTVTKKTLPRAVDRNRVKRVLREVFRRHRALFPDDADVVVVARRGAEALGFDAAREELAAAAAELSRAARTSAARERTVPRDGRGGRPQDRGRPS